ncbi:MAG: PTS system mannose/fructose/sorbose family transporter subunit IID [Elusimicrobiota bacterium]
MERRLQMSMFARSLLLQSCWNYEGMQNLGFLFGMDPLLRRVYPDREAYRSAALRHLGFFNTHPYMVGFVLGAVGALEERRSGLPQEKRGAADSRIEKVKSVLGAALAAIGDAFFWGALKPACAAVTMLVWAALWTFDVPHPVFWGAFVYLALYNAPALWVRWNGIRMGYALQQRLPIVLKRLRWQQKARWVRRVGLASAALAAAGALVVPPWGGTASLWSVGILAAALGLRACGIPTLKTYAAAAALGAGAALVGL